MKRTIYIFLDIDGVLNSESAYIYNYQQVKKGLKKDTVAVINEERLIVFDDLCRKISRANYEYRIILSSTWRKSDVLIETIQDRLDNYNLKIHDKTKILGIGRGYEIKEYCDRFNIPKEDIVILDDDSDMEDYSDRLVQTYFRDGLTYFDTERALIMLRLEEYVWFPKISNKTIILRGRTHEEYREV